MTKGVYACVKERVHTPA